MTRRRWRRSRRPSKEGLAFDAFGATDERNLSRLTSRGTNEKRATIWTRTHARARERERERERER